MLKITRKQGQSVLVGGVKITFVGYNTGTLLRIKAPGEKSFDFHLSPHKNSRSQISFGIDVDRAVPITREDDDA